jgi:hypothetical protein
VSWSGIRKNRWLRATSVLACVVATAAFVIFLSTLSSSGSDLLDAGNKIAGILGLVVAVATLVGGLAAQRRAGTTDPDKQLNHARQELVYRLSEEWSTEAAARGLSNPQPLKVRWVSTRRDVTAAPDEIVGVWAGRTIRLNLHGDVTTIADAFRQLPARQLVVIGRPEAGKTSLAVLLVRALLNDWQPDEPVPLMLNLTGWDPTREHLETWVSVRLRELYPWLADESQYGANAAARLVADHGRGILPVLDGLDELSEPLRHTAILALNKVIGGDRQLVLTCRSDDYETAVIAAGVPLTRAAVVEIEEVTAAQAGIYLPLGQRDGVRRWAPVIAHMKAHTDGALARALSTPLMVYLARTAYTTGDPRPLTMFTDQEAVEEHLLRGYLPAIYGPRLPGRVNGPVPLFQCTDAQAKHWLGFLARQLQRQPTDDLAWWKLSVAAPRWLVGVACGTVAATVGTLVLPAPSVGQGSGRFAGLGLGLIAALSCGLLVRSWIPKAQAALTRGLAGGLLGSLAGVVIALMALGAGPANVRLGSYLGAGVVVGVAVASLRGIVVGLLAGFVGEVVVTIYEHADAFHAMRISVGEWARVANGIGLGLAVGLATGLVNRTGPARGTRWSPLGLISGLTAGTAFGFSVWVQVRSLGGTIVWIVTILIAGYVGGVFFEGAPVDVAKATTPYSVLIRDRATFRACVVVVGLVAVGLGLTYGFATPDIPNGVEAGLAVGLVNSVAAGLALAFNQASWGSYTLSRCWLAASGQLPWRLMAFLDDAHIAKGILRQIGPMYQFRHTRLRDYLAQGR